MTDVLDLKSLSLELAKKIADSAIDHSRAKGLKMHVTVLDVLGAPLVYQRDPGAPMPAREFSERKAYTALNFKKPTSSWKQRLSENPHLATGLSQHPNITMIAGGLPIVIDGTVVGAIGIAGGLEEDDEIVAQAALDSVLS